MRKKLLLGQPLMWQSRDSEKHEAEVSFDNGWKLKLEHYTRWKQPADKVVWVITYSPNNERAFYFGTFNYDGVRYPTHNCEVVLPWEALHDYAKWIASFERRHAYLSAYESLIRLTEVAQAMHEERMKEMHD